MKNYFPLIAGRYKFMDSQGKTYPPSAIVRKYKKKYDSMTPEEFEKWLYEEHHLQVFFC